ncbi:MAG TPA: ATP-binding protein, partial [Opitutus sp.]|nr:ATP-binding protein [Opitutus sp.]
IELLHWIEDDVPGAIVADVGRLRQVVVNLVNNAVKFTAEGEVDVRVRLLRLEPLPPAAPSVSETPLPVSRCVLEFSVRDSGIGIAPEHHGKIFRPFSQVDDSTTRRYGGTGLGLAICKNIVELMDGAISFASEPGRGSTFTFTIRVPVQPTPGAASAARPKPLEGKRMMAAAAHPGLRNELARLGNRLGADAIEVEPAALGTRSDWDLAVVDVTGPAAMELAARNDPRPGLPADKIVALVPIVLPGELRSALRTHFRLVLNKPLHHDMLASLLSPSVVAPEQRPASTAATDAPAAPPNAGFGFRVLIVEDNAVNQRLIQKVITKLGCEWMSAMNCRTGLEELSRSRPEIVLMDLHMPELDGLTAITKIRAGEAGPAMKDVWIIALTADAREEQRERTLAAGANDYLTKPVQLPELTAAFRRYAASRS